MDVSIPCPRCGESVMADVIDIGNDHIVKDVRTLCHCFDVFGEEEKIEILSEMFYAWGDLFFKLKGLRT